VGREAKGRARSGAELARKRRSEKFLTINHKKRGGAGKKKKK